MFATCRGVERGGGHSAGAVTPLSGAQHGANGVLAAAGEEALALGTADGAQYLSLADTRSQNVNRSRVRRLCCCASHGLAHWVQAAACMLVSCDPRASYSLQILISTTTGDNVRRIKQWYRYHRAVGVTVR